MRDAIQVSFAGRSSEYLPALNDLPERAAARHDFAAAYGRLTSAFSDGLAESPGAWMRSGRFDVGFVNQVRGRQPLCGRDDSGKLDL
jgi:hypothetical protein